ncbi:MAG: hypothetical protein LKM35_04425 [Lachnospiraceae bacterium]|nr:hypothetical protein [Lachnospiraceae bacterium]MCI1726916.1 hypothetical protein [Lachnospiraceae bacterium]
MEYQVKVTVLDKKLFPELQEQYCAVPDSGKCPCYNIGDEFIFCRNDGTRPVIFKIERMDMGK